MSGLFDLVLRNHELRCCLLMKPDSVEGSVCDRDRCAAERSRQLAGGTRICELVYGSNEDILRNSATISITDRTCVIL